MMRYLPATLVLPFLAGGPAVAHEGAGLQHIHLTDHLSIAVIALAFLVLMGGGLLADILTKRARARKERRDS